CEPLLLAWNVIGHAGEGLAGHDDLASYDFGQGVSGIDAVILHIRARGVPVDDDRCTRGGYGNLQTMSGRRRIAAASEDVETRIADFDRDARLVRSLRRKNLLDVHRAELVAQRRPTGWRLVAVKGLEAAGRQRADRQRANGAHQLRPRAESRTLVMPPH